MTFLRSRIRPFYLPLLAVVLAALVPLPDIEAQAPAPPQEMTPEQQAATFGEEVSVGYVLVPVVVRSGAGYARNLDADDFRLLVDGRRVKIESFERRAEAPASVVFLQDLSGSMANAGKLDTSREVARFFLDRALPGDEYSVATFAGLGIQVEVPFTTQIPVVRESLATWKPYGQTALHDAVAGVPKISLEGRNPKRFAILVTDGIDNASQVTPEQAREIVRSAQLPVYVLGLGSGDPTELTAEGEKLYRYSDVLNLLAFTSGGRYYSITRPEELQEALTAIQDDMRHQYVLGFSTGDGRVSWRDVRVEVEGRRRAVLFRRGYKGTPPA
jgi:Ca-activated chloride channel family protein